MVALQRSGTFSIWDDTKIQPGANGKRKFVRRWITQQSGFCLLAATSSRPISSHARNLPPLLVGKRIFWIAVGASRYMDTVINDYQSVNDPKRPINKLRPAQRDELWVEIVGKLKAAVENS